MMENYLVRQWFVLFSAKYFFVPFQDLQINMFVFVLRINLSLLWSKKHRDMIINCEWDMSALFSQVEIFLFHCNSLVFYFRFILKRLFFLTGNNLGKYHFIFQKISWNMTFITQHSRNNLWGNFYHSQIICQNLLKCFSIHIHFFY